jgi:hypothetical protein
MIPPNETFDGRFAFKHHHFTQAGFRMHYVNERQGFPFLCLHGEPTWGFLYCEVIPPVQDSSRRCL